MCLMRKFFIALCLVAVSTAYANGNSAPSNSDKEDIINTARRVNDYFMQKYNDPAQPTNVKKVRPSSLWTRAVYYEGLMAFYNIDNRQSYIDYTDRWGNAHKWTARGGIETTDADNQCCEQTYLERFVQTRNEAMTVHVKENLDHQIATKRFDYWTWIDAIQMAMPVFVKYYKISGEKKYLDYAVKSYKWSRNTCGGGLFNTKEGLWWRDKDFVPPYKEKYGQNCYWSRGNGWVYASLVRSMEQLSPKSKEYKLFKKDFLLMSEGLRKCQREDGFWNVSLVSPVTYGGPEMTGTALFLYGMSWGIRQGLLDAETYKPLCDKAWHAIRSCVHASGFLGWNQGTGKDPSAGQPLSYYKAPDFEDYGTGCWLLGATEYYKLLNQ